MSSRKKITIAFVAVVLVVAAVTAALVSVLASGKHTVTSGFKVSYSADGVVAATVSAKYKKTANNITAAPTAFGSAEGSAIGTEKTFNRGDGERTESLNGSNPIEVNYGETELSILFEFKFVNNSSSGFSATLTMSAEKPSVLSASKNLQVRYYDVGSSSWKDFGDAGNSWTVAGNSTGTYAYLQVTVIDPERSFSDVGFNFNWLLEA